MAANEKSDAKAERLLNVLIPFLRQLLRDSPDYGKINLGATIHDGDIGNVSLSAEVSRKVAPRADRGRV